jgi:plastocyanin
VISVRESDRARGTYTPPMTRAAAVLAGLVAVVLLGVANGAAAPVQAQTLTGTVGPEFTISLRDAQGNQVTKLDPGQYVIEVDDRSDFHNFHLTGPGVNQSTQVGFIGSARWTVTLGDGTYRFMCDPHVGTMRGSITVGTPQVTPPKSPGAVTAKTKLVLTSGPSFSITLETSAGKAVKRMALGTYKVTVRDRGAGHNAHVIAPGYNRRTQPLAYRGTQTWTVKLARTGSFRFLCDPHAAAGMRGSAKIVR